MKNYYFVWISNDSSRHGNGFIETKLDLSTEDGIKKFTDWVTKNYDVQGGAMVTFFKRLREAGK